jgi:hypothetical protein
MPWCDHCSKYWAPSAMRPDGTCPRCGADLDPPDPPGSNAAGSGDAEEKAPWHFKVMVVALVVYLVYRFGTMFFG